MQAVPGGQVEPWVLFERAVLAAGWSVYGVSRRLSPEFAALQGEHAGRAYFHAFDLGRVDAVKAELFEPFLPFALPLHGFVNNAAVAYDDLVSAGSYAKARELGKLRIESKEYVVADGDVMEFRFNVSQ